MVGTCGMFRVVQKGMQRFPKKMTQLVSWIPINVQCPCIATEKSHVT